MTPGCTPLARDHHEQTRRKGCDANGMAGGEEKAERREKARWRSEEVYGPQRPLCAFRCDAKGQGRFWPRRGEETTRQGPPRRLGGVRRLGGPRGFGAQCVCGEGVLGW